ncbi:MAG TPA: outer membrane protein assembly factor BamA [Steroidobacteraceae bacterium]|nr:outer membrane protein assembly factor BamA [Steroidobacteraceae bacterium]
MPPVLVVGRRLSYAALAIGLMAWFAAPVVGQPLPLPEADQHNFTVGDIRVEGLQRVSEGTVYNYLPVNIGDVLTPQRVREAVRALYATGFFRDVQLRREGTTLVVVVQERPSIESFEITGNKDIKTEDLQKSLRNVGLAAGKTFDRSVLEDVQQYLTDQYFSRGKYAVRIDAKVEEQSGNRVKIKIDIKEGARAKIRQINIVGNQAFTDAQIIQSFELKTPNWLSWYKQDDRYSRESLQGDLEKLRSFYMDRGYANFQVESTQVAIAPEKDDIFITVNIDEGAVYRVSEVKLAGTFVVPEAELRKLLLIQPGQIFSRKLITATQELMQNRMGQDGYAFAKVDPVPTTNDEKKQVSLTFFVDPGNRVYVRNITFAGQNRINDEVLRREMRQLEGGWLSNVALDRSKQRIQRLSYVKTVTFETTPVPGSADMVDVNFQVEEGPSAQLSGGIGYSESQKFILNGSYADANFLGSGERVALELQGGLYSKVYSLSQTNPYATVDGIQRVTTLSYRDITQFVSNASALSSKTLQLGLEYAYPLTEYQVFRFGGALQTSQLLTSATGSALQAIDWVQQNGHSFTDTLYTNGITYYLYGTRFTDVLLSTGWSFDTRNRTLFPTSGARHAFSVQQTVPGTDVQYGLASYEFQQFFHLPYLARYPISITGRLAQAYPEGNTTAVPPYSNFYLGGPDSVRGIREGTLGPRDSHGNPYGGNLALTGQVEAILPVPEKFSSTARATLFYDFGQVASKGNVLFTDKGGFPVDYAFTPKNFVTSTGVAVQWLAPLGLFKFSYAIPLKYHHDSELNYGDDIEHFQFSIGQAF